MFWIESISKRFFDPFEIALVMNVTEGRIPPGKIHFLMKSTSLRSHKIFFLEDQILQVFVSPVKKKGGGMKGWD
jgi:hypothetical protein